MKSDRVVLWSTVAISMFIVTSLAYFQSIHRCPEETPRNIGITNFEKGQKKLLRMKASVSDHPPQVMGWRVILHMYHLGGWKNVEEFNDYIGDLNASTAFMQLSREELEYLLNTDDYELLKMRVRHYTHREYNVRWKNEIK